MKLFTFLAALVSMTSAQYLTNQTSAFNLELVSNDDKWNGQYLGSCHAGAAIEALCPSGTVNPAPYYFNFSSPDGPSSSTLGFLTWVLHGGNFNLSEPMSLSYNPVTNIAATMLQPSGTGQYVGFDADDMLYISGFDDSVFPRNYSQTVQYYRWHICNDVVGGYTYNALFWRLGDAAPDNPTCSYVNVKRKFV